MRLATTRLMPKDEEFTIYLEQGDKQLQLGLTFDDSLDIDVA